MFRIFILHLFKKYFNSLRRKKRIFYKETKFERKGYKVNDLYLRLKTKTRRTCRLKRHRRNGKAPCGAIFAQLALVNRLLLGRKCEPNLCKHKDVSLRLSQQNKNEANLSPRFVLVRETGIEPVWHNHTPLKRARLPIPPLSHI